MVHIKDTKAQSYRGYLKGCISKCVHDNNKELEILFQEMLRKFNEFYPDKIVKNEIRILDGWKGEGSTEVYKGFTDDFRIVEHIKDKGSLEVKESYHTVLKEDINRMLFIIRDLEIQQTYKCYYIAKKLGYSDWKSLWKERQDYFRLYYYPIKVAEALGLICYSGRGQVTRIK